jgi:hypothetical protein
MAVPLFLESYAGRANVLRTVLLRLENAATDGVLAFGYWSGLDLRIED